MELWLREIQLHGRERVCKEAPGHCTEALISSTRVLSVMGASEWVVAGGCVLEGLEIPAYPRQCVAEAMWRSRHASLSSDM